MVQETTASQPFAKLPVMCSLQAGQIVDILIVDEWKERYGYVERVEEDGVVWTMRYCAHDGCCWTYKYSFDSVRVSSANCT